ncbi:nephrocystin-4-like, partial [Silurus asotus]
MDPADDVQSQLFSLVQLTTSHHQQIQELASAIRELVLQRNPAPVAQASVLENPTAHAAPSAAPAPVPPPAPRCGVHLPTPERFAGQPGECRPFLLSCEITFQLQPFSFPNELTKVAYVISLLLGKAKRWATGGPRQSSSVCASYCTFPKELRKIFDSATPRQGAARSLFQTIQDRALPGRCSRPFKTDFRTATAESEWDSTALYDIFLRGLNAEIKNKLATRDLSEDRDSLISLATRIDRRMRKFRSDGGFRGSWQPVSPSDPSHFSTSSSLPPQSMEIGCRHLSTSEKEMRRSQGLCLYC